MAQAFFTTRWSLVLAVRDPLAAREALESLCSAYWFPLYAYVRRRGVDCHTAQDLTQAFFAQLIGKQTLSLADQERGRFRSFLLTSFRNFLKNEWEREGAAKRGGRVPVLSLNFGDAESRLNLRAANCATSEAVFDREWGLSLLELVLRRLQNEQQSERQREVFEVLSPCLAGSAAGYTAAADRLGINAAAVRQAVSRLRKRYREILREEVGQTVASPDGIDDEIRALFSALGG